MKKIVIILILICLGVAAWGTLIVFPRHMADKVEAMITRQCPTCQFHINGISVNPATGTVFLNSINFVSDPEGSTVINAKIGSVKIWMNIQRLMEKKIEVSHLEVSDVHLIVEEKHHEKKPPPDPKALAAMESSYGGKFLEVLPPLQIDGLNIQNGNLEYILKIFDKEAKIFVSDINAEISPLGTREGLGPRFVDLNVTARLQKSGLVTVRGRADLFSVVNRDKIEIDVEHQDLSELNTFFFIEDGIKLRGELHKAHAAMDLTRGNLSGEMWAHYEKMEFHMQPTPDAGIIEATVTNILEKLKTVKTKPSKGEPPPRAVISYKRKSGQGLINFILQGLKEAAFKVIAS